MKKKECSECGDNYYGRSDKRFCSDHCRSSYNNRLNCDSSKTIRNINNRLRKNRRILMEIVQSGLDEVQRELLLELGFNFRYITDEHKSAKGETYRFCYDQGYCPKENQLISIVTRNACFAP